MISNVFMIIVFVLPLACDALSRLSLLSCVHCDCHHFAASRPVLVLEATLECIHGTGILWSSLCIDGPEESV